MFPLTLENAIFATLMKISSTSFIKE